MRVQFQDRLNEIKIKNRRQNLNAVVNKIHVTVT